MKPYQKVSIQECGESLVPIPLANFAVVTPHPYAELGAPYGNFSPYFVRRGVLDKLKQAQSHLQNQKPGWQLQIFDAYRPIPVQQFMVDYTFAQLVEEEGWDIEQMQEKQRSQIQAKVLNFWAIPSKDPHMPPPHSTGAAIDLTLVNEAGATVNMGSPIDEISPRSYPNHFANQTDSLAQEYHGNRQLLTKAMVAAGFRQHPNEWWHFSYGDQLWAWQMGGETIARYGGALT